MGPAIGTTATPEEFDPRHRRGRKPYDGDDSREAKAYFDGVTDGTNHTINVLVGAFIAEGKPDFTLEDVKRIIRREEW